MRYNLTTKMILCFSLVVLVAVLGFAYTINMVGIAANEVAGIKTKDLPSLERINEISYNSLGQSANLRGYSMYGKQQYVDEYRRLLALNGKLEDELIMLAKDEETRRTLNEIKALEKQYGQLADNKFLPAMQAGKRDDADRAAVEMAPVGKALNDKVAEIKALNNKLMTQSMEEAVSGANAARQASIIAAVLSVILGIVIGAFSARSIVKPLKFMVTVCNEFAAGDFRDKPRQMIRKDEIGDLANALAAMRDSVRVLMKQVNISAEQVAAASEELTASAEQSAQAANQVAEAITDVAQGTNEQINAVSQTMAEVEQISAAIQQTAATANHVSSAAANTTDAVKEGQQAVNKAVLQMDNVGKGAQALQKTVDKLADSSKEIGQIVNVIRGIAGQTNLLALNAAIEAARAGDAGRGFAVVAEEVRKLAEQSETAAKQITNLVTDNTTSIDSAVAVMNTSAEDIKVGIDVVNGAGVAFESIAEQITVMAGQVREISAATQEVAAGSQRIVESVKHIEESSKGAAVQAETVSAATEEQSASMEEIASSSQALSKLASDMQQAVSVFKI